MAGNNDNRPVESPDVSSLTLINSDDCYKMNNSKRGYCLIINNKIFNEESERKGTDIDATGLENLFRNLEWVVKREDNKTVEEMISLIDNVSKRDHSNSDSFVLAILSHGNEQGIWGVDKVVTLDKLLEPLKHCPSLVGKPKFILIQGDKKDEGNDVTFDGDGDDVVNVVSKIPIEADYLFAYSTVPAKGYVSCRDEKKGSRFIQKIIEVFGDNKMTRQFDILQLLTRVNQKVAFEYEGATNEKFKQMPFFTSTLTKDFHLRWKY